MSNKEARPGNFHLQLNQLRPNSSASESGTSSTAEGKHGKGPFGTKTFSNSDLCLGKSLVNPWRFSKAYPQKVRVKMDGCVCVCVSCF